ncbi:caspase family protein [Iningainema tapete]|uniref:Caspase family protein n=1 Tax=Iningainema tapete BLCC-T55 TaxID=2748662 RepID=A0A8J6XD25_9CYAN|nr:caspase family protein [Iningainema tapete]MBD2773570.1 caspase family protein [Iningainema tapete BLCC-T55]
MIRNLYALLVGIDNYPDPNHCLQGCVNDITVIEEYLNERFDRKEYQLHLLTLKNDQATREAVIHDFRKHLCQAGKDDIVMFYYSGHGSQELAPKEFWQLEPDHLDETIVCYDSRTENGWDLADKELALLIAEVAEKNPHMTIIMDCCHSGSGTKDPMQQTKVRRFPTDKRERPLDSFIFTLEDLNRLLGTSEVKPEDNPTGWRMPKGSHVLLAACRDYETAKEYYGDDQHRGGFSYFLMDTLSRTNGKKLTYRDLFGRTNALVRGKIAEQSPQLEVNNPLDDNKFFLDGAIAELEPYFMVKNDKISGWAIKGGAVHGVQPPKNGETTLLALFPFDATIEDLRDPSKSVGTAKVTQVLPTKSKIDIEGVQNLTADATFKAVVTSLPLPPLGVHFEGDEAGVTKARDALKTAGLNRKQPSPYVREEQELAKAPFRLLCRNEQYLIARPTDDRPLVDQIDGYTSENADKAIKRLEHIARWTTIAELSNTATTQIKAGDVKMELIFTSEELSQSKQMRLQYKFNQDSNQWESPEFKLKLTNNSKKQLYFALVNLSDNFSISAPFFETGSIRLKPGEEAYALNGEYLILEVPDELSSQGITEYKDIIKLIVSNDEFDARLLTQDKLDAPRPPASRDIDSLNHSSLERLMNRTQNREVKPKSTAKFDDWYAEEITITTVRPLNSTPVSRETEQQLGAGVKLQPHHSLVANARLTTTPQVSRDLGNKILPPILREDREVIRPFQFTHSRGTDPGLSVLQLTDVADYTVVTPDAPLKLLVDAPLADNEYLLPVGYDGEFFLPLGRGTTTQDGKTEIILEQLPAPVSQGERSIQGSIRIFFEKVISQNFGREFKYPILAVADVGDDKKVNYKRDAADVQQRVAQAKRIALYIHGIVGDTESLVNTIKQPVLQVDGQKRSISELYDVVLTFDYENLNTSIEQNALHLKQRLADVGLGENHSKELHIIAHSMGGLVSRWFIEREGGNKVVQHLIMLGTPNAGSPWPAVEDWVKLTLAVGLNGLSSVAWPASVVAMLMGALEKNLRVALTQMNPKSDFINSLAASHDPGIPYSIIAGNTSIIPAALSQQPSSVLERLQQSLFKKVVALPFFGVPNDIAVTVDSIKSIPHGRSHPSQIQEVACDHLSYFFTSVGLEALAAAIIKQ